MAQTSTCSTGGGPDTGQTTSVRWFLCPEVFLNIEDPLRKLHDKQGCAHVGRVGAEYGQEGGCMALQVVRAVIYNADHCRNHPRSLNRAPDAVLILVPRRIDVHLRQSAPNVRRAPHTLRLRLQRGRSALGKLDTIYPPMLGLPLLQTEQRKVPDSASHHSPGMLDLWPSLTHVSLWMPQWQNTRQK